MRLRNMLFTLAVLAAAPVAADDDIDMQMKHVEAALNRIQAEQQAVYQQFQMVQELRRQETQRIEQSLRMNEPTAQPRNYDDVVRENQARADRGQQYADEASRLYDRYRELGEQKRPLLERLNELAQQR